MPRNITPDDTTALYRLAFNQVCNKTDWKDRIEAIVPEQMAALYADAIVFMTGTPAFMTPVAAGLMELRSIGYRAGPAGP